MSSTADFRRQMPEASRDLRQPISLAQRWHIDVPLLILLLALSVYGLSVLYSASGQNFYYMKRQMIFFRFGLRRYVYRGSVAFKNH